MGKRIVFTGGSGKAGRHVVPYLVERGHQVLNLDLKPLDHPGVPTLVTDVTDSGQVFNALSMHFDFKGLETGRGPAPRAWNSPLRLTRRCTPSPTAPHSIAY